MDPIPAHLVSKNLRPRKTPSGKSPALILLHGRGADENDLLGLAPSLDERLTIFSIRAPFPFEYGGFTYFDVGNDGTADPAMFLESYRLLTEFIDGVAATSGVDAEKIFLMGFSMGTIMSYALSLTNPGRFAGVAAQSGFIREHPQLRYRWEDVRACPFIITHGTSDPIIPVQLARDARKLLARSNADFVYKEYAMGHQISEESLGDVCDWLGKKLG